MNIPTVLKLTTSWSPCEAPRASARDQRARDQRDIISHGSQSQAGASSLQSIKGSSLSSSFDWRYVQKPEQQIIKAHIWSKQWSGSATDACSAPISIPFPISSRWWKEIEAVAKEKSKRDHKQIWATKTNPPMVVDPAYQPPGPGYL